jgi:hypothetical protein
MKTKRKQTNQRTLPERASKMLVTVGILEEFREETRASFRSQDRKTESCRNELKSSIDEVLAEVRRTRMLSEEQNNKNNIVLDGLSVLFGRQERVETRVDDIEHTIATFKKVSR